MQAESLSSANVVTATFLESPSATPAHREQVYQSLLQAAVGLPNDLFFAQMLASQYSGTGYLPRTLGLSEKAFQTLLNRHFPRCHLPPSLYDRPLDINRIPELDDLRQLLKAGVTPLNNDNAFDLAEEQQWLIEIVLHACMGNDHLWQDLGLWSRQALSQLLQQNFEPLAARNTQNMKWKKFFYKQLCSQEGIYVCRAPSCQVCSDYHNCFGEE